MVITILVEPLGDDGFRAVAGEPLRAKVDAPTRQEAVEKLRQMIEARLCEGAEVVNLQVGESAHPLVSFAGMLEDDPLLEPWKAAIDEYRDQSESSF